MSSAMKYGKVPGIDKPISRLVQGTVPIKPMDPEARLAFLDAVYAMGCNTFDTAHIYGTEQLLAEWIHSRSLREKVVILTKGAHQDKTGPRVTPADILADLNESLRRMQTDYIDLYVLHRDNPAVPVGPIVEALHEQRQAGKIRAFGGSNWTHQRLQAANDYARSKGLTPFAVSSPNYSLAEQVVVPWAGCVSISGPGAAEAQAWYAKTKMPVFSWSSLAGGFFSGRFTRENLDSFTDGLDKLAAKCYRSEENLQRLDRVTELAKEKGLTVPQIATAFIMDSPLNVFALVGCRKAEEFQANVEALALKLTAAEMAWLDLKSPTR